MKSTEMKKLIVLSFLVLQFSAKNVFSQINKGGQSLRDTTELSEFIDSLFHTNSFSGIVAITKGNAIIYKHYNGYSDKGQRIPISEETIFNVGSLAKIFTGVAIMQLIEANKIRLFDPVSLYIPEYPNKEWANKATIQNLLTHTSGLGDFFPHDHNFKNLYDLNEIVNFIGKTTIANLPSDRMIYSNAGFYLLGRIIEKVSGENYFAYMQKNVFDKAGMKSTYFRREDGNKKFAKGYLLNEMTGQYESNENVINEIGGPAGGAMTRISDLLSFQNALKNNVLISDVSFKNMSEIKVTGSRGMGYGLGIGVGKFPNGSKWIGHNGGGPGIAANYSWFTDTDYSMFVFLNQDSSSNMSLMLRTKFLVSEMK